MNDDLGTLADHVILTQADGALRGMDVDAVNRIVDAAAASERVVLHFHGGLVSEQRGREIAESLFPVYRDAGAYPIFFVWRSGLIEILRGHLGAIAGEDAFKALTKLVLKFAVGKVLGAEDAKGPVPSGRIAVPGERELVNQLARRESHQEPFADVDVDTSVPELTAAEERNIEQQLRNDPQLRAVSRAITEATLPASQREGAKSATDVHRASENTLMSPHIVDELQEDAPLPGQKGAGTALVLARHGVRVVRKVIGRFRSGRDHGVYPTVVEEILREFYVANAGGRIWAKMKEETSDTFAVATPARGGATFMQRLGGALRGGARPEISLVGHSTGAVFINNLLGHVEQMRGDPDEPLPDDFRFHAIAFLAPACTFTDFAPVLDRRDDLWRHFRMFTMTDAAESKDGLVPLVYPRSLLYFVSGLLETGPDGKGEAGKPLVGLARCFDRVRDDDPPDVKAVRDWIRGDELVVWSPADGGPGFTASALSHGEFDDDEKVRASLKVLIGGPH